jgi:hypothetical protein
MSMTCSKCDGPVEMNGKKVATVIGGSAVIMLFGAMLGTPTGWIALLPLMLAGNQNAAHIVRAKYQLMKASQEAGGYFRCRDCKRDIPISEVFA